MLLFDGWQCYIISFLFFKSNQSPILFSPENFILLSDYFSRPDYFFNCVNVLVNIQAHLQ